MQSLMTWQPYVFSNIFFFFFTSFTSEQKKAHAPYILILLVSLSKAKGCGSGSEPHLRFSSVSCSPAPPPATSFQAYQTTIYADSQLHRPQKVSASSYTTTTHARALPMTWRLSAGFKIMKRISCRRHARLQTACRYSCLSGRAASVPGMKEFSWEQSSGARLTSHRKKISGEIWFSLSKTLTCMRSVPLLLTSVR